MFVAAAVAVVAFLLVFYVLKTRTRMKGALGLGRDARVIDPGPAFVFLLPL